jgi:glucose-1-phosphate cytidylyltransferase
VKIIILAGGFGTRISEYTDTIPKPMVQIGGKPMLWHIMNLYAQYKYKNFLVALGYKGEQIKKYFSKKSNDWNIELVETGEKTMTGGRVKRLQKFVGNETCMLTYGDGIADIDLNALVDFHKSHGKLVTVSAVRPPARFGAISLDGNRVKNFKEKSHTEEGWINGGFFVIEPDFFNYIDGDETFLEREPLEKAVSKGELFAYKHNGFWQCMDTKRDRDHLEEIYMKEKKWPKSY